MVFNLSPATLDKQTAWSLLNEAVVDAYGAAPKRARAPKPSAASAAWHGSSVTMVSPDQFKTSFEEGYQKALESLLPATSKQFTAGQVQDALNAEADVGHAIYYNILVPTIVVLNAVLEAAKADWVATIQSETYGVNKVGPGGEMLDGEQSIRTDHLIVLICKENTNLIKPLPGNEWPSWENVTSSLLRKARSYVLAVVEDKRRGYLTLDLWKQFTKDKADADIQLDDPASYGPAEIAAYLPQILMYAQTTKAPESILTDYDTFVYFHWEALPNQIQATGKRSGSCLAEGREHARWRIFVMCCSALVQLGLLAPVKGGSFQVQTQWKS